MTYGSEHRLLAEIDSGAATCPMAPELVSRLRWASALPRILWLRHCHVSYDSGAVTCPKAPCGPRILSIKESLADLPVQLGIHVSNARAHISKAPHIRAIMHLQYMRAGSVVNTYKACRHASTVWLHYNISTMDHLSSTTTVPK
jgi:hypothetical protein